MSQTFWAKILTLDEIKALPSALDGTYDDPELIFEGESSIWTTELEQHVDNNRYVELTSQFPDSDGDFETESFFIPHEIVISVVNKRKNIFGEAKALV